MLNKIKFPNELNTRINMSKIRFESFKKWISEKIENLLGVEDDILVGIIIIDKWKN